MGTAQLTRQAVIACLALLCAPSTKAEIYKWVDENGKTHYSDSKEQASKANAEALKMKSASGSTRSASAPDWQEQEREFQRRRLEKEQQEAKAQKVTQRPKSLSNGRSDNTDQSKCNLARDVLSGAVRHSNGKPTDKYDREVAERDVQKYCR